MTEEDGPPEGGGYGKNLEESGPLWQVVSRLIADEESAREMHGQLGRAMVSPGLAAALSQQQQRQHLTTASERVAAELEGLGGNQGYDEQHRKQQVLLAALRQRSTRWHTNGLSRVLGHGRRMKQE